MKRLIFILAVGAMGVTGCYEPPITGLSEKGRARVDSLYVKELKLVKIEVDSICNELKGEYKNRVIDSIRSEYIKEIERIVG